MISQNTAISRLENKHSNLDFSKFNYINRYNESIIICKIHNIEFKSNYNKLISNKYGCYLCKLDHIKECNDKYNNRYKDNLEILKNKFPKLDFSKAVYVNNKTNIILICKEHGEFEASYNNLRRSKYGCPICFRESKKNNSSYIINKLSSLYSNYDFSKFKYIHKEYKSQVICKKHGTFNQSYANMTKKGVTHPCPICQIKVSKAEDEIYKFITSIYNNTVDRNNRNIIKSKYKNRFLELDFYLPDIRLAIEFNGSYWHSDNIISKRKYFNSAEEYHKYKLDECSKMDIELIYINENDWINDKDNILNNIKNKIERRI